MLQPCEQRDILEVTLPRRGWVGRQVDMILNSRRRPRIEVSGFISSRVVLPGGQGLPWHTFPNGAVYQGLNKDLDVMFRNQAAHASWYALLIRNTGFTGENINDTMASHGGWVEETQYTAGTRPQWSPTAATLGQLTISSPISLVASATIDVKGVGITSVNTKGDNTGTLWATAVEGSARNVINGATYEFFYSVIMTPAN